MNILKLIDDPSSFLGKKLLSSSTEDFEKLLSDEAIYQDYCLKFFETKNRLDQISRKNQFKSLNQEEENYLVQYNLKKQTRHIYNIIKFDPCDIDTEYQEYKYDGIVKIIKDDMKSDSELLSNYNFDEINHKLHLDCLTMIDKKNSNFFIKAIKKYDVKNVLLKIHQEKDEHDQKLTHLINLIHNYELKQDMNSILNKKQNQPSNKIL